MKTHLFTYSLALLLAMGLTPLVILWARKKELVDKPNIRKIRSLAVPRVGGIAIFVGTILAIIPLFCLPTMTGQMFRSNRSEILVLLITSTCIFVGGLYDDVKNARFRTKLALEILTAIAIIAAGIRIDTIHIRGLSPINLGWLGYVMTFIWIIGITNAVNLIDGLDGLAAGVSGLACGVIAVLSILQGNTVLALIMLALLGALTGFLFFNFHPARIFMGDCGSLFLGFFVATASVMTAAKSETLVGMGLSVLVLGIPIFDTLLSLLRRFLGRRSIVSPDREHFHHRLIEMGFKQHHVAIIAYAVTAGITGIGFFMIVTRGMASVSIFLVCLLSLLVLFGLIGSIRLGDVRNGINQHLKRVRQSSSDQRAFEQAQLNFRNAKTFDQWWGCVCTAAKVLDFAYVSLELASHQNSSKSRTWVDDNNGDTDIILESLLQMRMSIKDRRLGNRLQMEIRVKPNGSLEAVGRRLALFNRLADEFGLTCLPDPDNHPELGELARGHGSQ